MLVGLERSKGKGALKKEERTEDSHKVSIQYFKQHQQHKKATKGVIRNIAARQKRSYLDTRINHIRDSKSVEASQEKQESRSAKVEDSIRQSKALCKGKRRPYYCKNALN